MQPLVICLAAAVAGLPAKLRLLAPTTDLWTEYPNVYQLKTEILVLASLLNKARQKINCEPDSALPLRGFLCAEAAIVSWTHCSHLAGESQKDSGRNGDWNLLAAQLKPRPISCNFGSVLVFSLLFTRICRDHEDFKKHHPPLELSFCCDVVLGSLHQRYNSKPAICYCGLSPPALINIPPSH